MNELTDFVELRSWEGIDPESMVFKQFSLDRVQKSDFLSRIGDKWSVYRSRLGFFTRDSIIEFVTL